MEITTKLFGKIKIDADKIIQCEILGFTQLSNFVLLDCDDDNLFYWLQSVENKDVAFPLTNYFSGNPHVFEIVTIPDNVEFMTANQKAPLVLDIGGKTMKQSIELAFNNKDKKIREPIFQKLCADAQAMGELFSAKVQSNELDSLLVDVMSEELASRDVVLQ